MAYTCSRATTTALGTMDTAVTSLILIRTITRTGRLDPRRGPLHPLVLRGTDLTDKHRDGSYYYSNPNGSVGDF